MPIFKSNETPGGRPARSALFGLTACRLWRRNPSVSDLRAPGAPLGEDLRRRVNSDDGDAWPDDGDARPDDGDARPDDGDARIREYRAKEEREEASREAPDPRLAEMKREILNLLDASLHIGGGSDLGSEMAGAPGVSRQGGSTAGRSVAPGGGREG